MSLYPCPMCSGWLFRDGELFFCDECDFTIHYSAYIDEGDDEAVVHQNIIHNTVYLGDDDDTQPILSDDSDLDMQYEDRFSDGE